MTDTLETEIELDGIGIPATVEYTATWYRGYKAPRIDGWLQQEPDEPAGWMIEIESVKAQGIELLPLLDGSDEWIAEMRAKIADELNALSDDDDSEYDDRRERFEREQDYYMDRIQESGI